MAWQAVKVAARWRGDKGMALPSRGFDALHGEACRALALLRIVGDAQDVRRWMAIGCPREWLCEMSRPIQWRLNVSFPCNKTCLASGERVLGSRGPLSSDPA